MQFKNLLLATLLPISITLSACSGGMGSESEAVKARQDVMKNWKDAMEVMGGMVEAPDTFDLAVFQENAQFLAEDAASPWSHYSDANDMGGSTEAVWSNPEGFKEESEKFQRVTAELNTTAQSATSLDEIKPAFGAVGKSCKSCHEEFKVADK